MDTPTRISPAWTPDQIDFSGRFSRQPEWESEVLTRFDMRQPSAGVSIEPTTLRTRWHHSGQLISDQKATAFVNEHERAAMAGLRDALAGTSYLTDAKPWASGPATLDTMRIAWETQGGQRQMLELPMAQPLAGYDALYKAINDYFRASGFGV